MAIDRKAAILEAFMKLVSRFGVDKTTMQDVAKEVGISVGVIYKDFKNKEDLVCTYIENLIDQVINHCQNIINQAKPAEELLHELIIGYFNMAGMILTNDQGFRQLLSEDPCLKLFGKGKMYEDLIDHKMTAMIESIMAQGVSKDIFEINDRQMTAILFYHAFNIFLNEWVFDKKNIDEVLPRVEQMYQFLIKAILKK